MLVHLRSDNFSRHYLRYVHQDPVHSITEQRNLDRRCRYDRNIFFWIEDDTPVAVLCVAYTEGLKDSIDDILDNNSPVSVVADHAIFYSVFRTDTVSTTQNAGARLIHAAARWIKSKNPHITNYVTMSPIPNLSAHFSEPPSIDSVKEFLATLKDPVAKFHVRNGAKILRVIPNADNSERRRAQSYSTMANYDYTHNLTEQNP